MTVLQLRFFNYAITHFFLCRTHVPTVGPPFSSPGFLVPHFQVLHFHPLTFGPAFPVLHFSFFHLFWSSISGPAFSVDPRKRQIFIPLPFSLQKNLDALRNALYKFKTYFTYLHDHLEPFWFFSKNFNTNWPSPYDIRRCKNRPLSKSWTLWVGCNNVTDDRQTNRQTDGRMAHIIRRA